MFHRSPQNHHKHHQMNSYQNWDTPIALPVYPVIQKPNKNPEAHQCPCDDEILNDKYGGFIPGALPVYPTIKSPPRRLPEGQYSYGNESFNEEYGGFVLVNPRGIRVKQYDQVPDEMQYYEEAPVRHAKANYHNHKVDEDVDAEAEEFIKLKHNKFLASKTINYSS